MGWDEFYAIPNGYRVFNNGWDQCVALANLYHESVLGGQFVPVASAFQWWTDFGRYPQLQNVYTQVPASGTPRAGDVYLGKGGIYNNVDGHIGIVVRDWDGSTFGSKEQNAENNRYTFQTYNRSKANVLGFLRPKKSPIVDPLSEVELSKVFIANVKGSWFLIVPQGDQKPRAVVLGGDSGAPTAGLPVFNFTWQPSIDALKAAVQGL